MAMTIIRFEIHHLWNPDWTYAIPYPQDDGYVDYAYEYDEQYNDDEGHDYPEVNGGQEVVETPPVVSDDDDEAQVAEPFDEFAEEVLNDFKMKDGGPIPCLR